MTEGRFKRLVEDVFGLYQEVKSSVCACGSRDLAGIIVGDKPMIRCLSCGRRWEGAGREVQKVVLTSRNGGEVFVSTMN